MKSIWKFPLVVEDVQTIQMPAFATPLCVQIQNNKPCLWAIVESENALESRIFFTIGTGHRVPPGKLAYISTYQLLNGGLVFHVFEKLFREDY